MMRTLLCSILLAGLGGFAITGCDQGQKAAKVSQPTVVRKFAQATLLEGTVSNNAGVIKTGTLVVTDENDHPITQVALEEGHFRVEIPANTILPILLNFSSESGKEKLVAVAIYDTISRYYINPTSTAIAKAAKEMGGYNRANLDRAAENTVHVPDSNKTTAGWRGDPTKQYGGWH